MYMFEGNESLWYVRILWLLCMQRLSQFEKAVEQWYTQEYHVQEPQSV